MICKTSEVQYASEVLTCILLWQRGISFTLFALSLEVW